MQLLGAILGQFMSVGVLALIIVFQQEVRRFLILLGTNSFLSKNGFSRKILPWHWKAQSVSNLNIAPVVKACATMAKTKTGAIMVIARTIDLKFYEATGDIVDAEVSKRLFLLSRTTLNTMLESKPLSKESSATSAGSLFVFSGSALSRARSFA